MHRAKRRKTAASFTGSKKRKHRTKDSHEADDIAEVAVEAQQEQDDLFSLDMVYRMLGSSEGPVLPAPYGLRHDVKMYTYQKVTV